MIKNKSAILLAAALLAGISPTAAQSAFAASASSEISAAAAGSAAVQTVSGGLSQTTTNELRLKLGSRRITVNGTSENILRAPYTANGTAMVPLGVFTSAFGAESRLSDGDVVKLILGSRKVTMTIGTPVIWTSKGKSKMQASPAMVGGVLMVPLRPVAEGLGASISNSNGELVVRLPKGLSGDAENGANGNEAGAAKVGSSLYGWSINDPGNLEKSSNPGAGSFLFSDPKGNYYLSIQTIEDQPQQDNESLLDNLAEEAKANQETLLHEEVVDGSNASYARMITSDVDGVLSESRAYYADHKVYLLYFSAMDAYYYGDFDSYAGLLNSFRTSFDGSNRKLKDLTEPKDGAQEELLNSEVYGIGFEAMPGWSAADNGTDFIGPQGSGIHINVSSNPSGQTIDNWTEQMKKQLTELYVPSALRMGEVTEEEVSGEKAYVLKAEVNLGDGWRPLDEILLIKGGYRYLVEYQGPVQGATAVAAGKTAESGTAEGTAAGVGANTESTKNAENAESTGKAENADNTNNTNNTNNVEKAALSKNSVLDVLVQSLDIPYDDIKEYFGKMEDRAQETDLTKMVLKSSTSGGFTLQIPRYWEAQFNPLDPSFAQYSFTGGSFKFAMTRTDDPALYLGDLASAYTAAASSGSGITVNTEKSVISGVPATIFTIHQTLDGIPVTKRVAAFSRKGNFYQMTFTLNDASATDEQKAAISAVEKSFVFVN